MRNGSGTVSNIGFILVGEDGDTGVRILDDGSHIVSKLTAIIIDLTSSMFLLSVNIGDFV